MAFEPRSHCQNQSVDSILRFLFLFIHYTFAAVLVFSELSFIVPIGAQAPEASDVSQELPSAITPEEFYGPPPPVPPAVISRDELGRATIRAVRLTSPLRLDGILNENVYTTVSSISDFIQQEPIAGAPATQKTECWVLFDENNIYVSVRAFESHPERMLASEMRRDNMFVFNGSDNITFIFDTFYDRRNGVIFVVNPVGGRAEGQITNERQYNGDFNPIWDVRVGRFKDGWTVEAAIPFKSLRYRPGASQVWGFNIKRENRWKNESDYVTPVPNALGRSAMMHLSLAPTLVGLEVPNNSKNLEIKPYAVADLTTNHMANPTIENQLSADAGLDVKYGITQNLTADFTYNTDFAQVEADEQQINLTRFKLFFPEKREFFLENRGTFDFAGVGGFGGNRDVPRLFYSRRIGLSGGQTVPIQAGGRLTGRIGRYSLGLLNIQSAANTDVGTPRTNFLVARIKRDILRRSSIGFLMTRRSIRENGPGSNEAYGIDGTFGFFDNLSISTHWARTHTDGLSGDDTSYRAQFDYGGDRYGLQLEHLAIGKDFNPDVGFLRRKDMRRHFGRVRFSPRPTALRAVRKFSVEASLYYLENGSGQLEERWLEGQFGIELENSDNFTLSYKNTYEFLERSFNVSSAATIAPGNYNFSVIRSAYAFGPHRRLSGTLALEHGTFYNGHRTTFAITSGRVELTPQFSLQPTASINFIDLPEGSFATQLIGSRVTYTMTPLMFVSGLFQYNSDATVAASNVRFRWEYQPGSELFIVYDEQRETGLQSLPHLSNRTLIVKINRLFRF